MEKVCKELDTSVENLEEGEIVESSEDNCELKETNVGDGNKRFNNITLKIANKDHIHTCRVYSGGLRDNANRYEVQDAFAKYGPVRDVCVARRPPGSAFVEMEDTRNAEDASKGLDGTRICGSRVKIEMRERKRFIKSRTWYNKPFFKWTKIEMSNGGKKRDRSGSRDSRERGRYKKRDRSRRKECEKFSQKKRDENSKYGPKVKACVNMEKVCKELDTSMENLEEGQIVELSEEEENPELKVNKEGNGNKKLNNIAIKIANKEHIRKIKEHIAEKTCSIPSPLDMYSLEEWILQYLALAPDSLDGVRYLVWGKIYAFHGSQLSDCVGECV
eukprot:GFUD01035004.1.p1 GENE.GFUD01035004.1~~GFUD01035004.1.p1  ORF type:complete len:357 (+),score=115.43 GFUD01035004.1:79-1071(+)